MNNRQQPQRDEPALSGEDPLEDGSVVAFLPLYAAVRARPWVVAGIIGLTMLACAAWLSVRSPTYEARAQILVTPLIERQTTFVGLPIIRTSPGDPTRTVETAASIASSPDTADVAAAKIDGVSGAQVRGAVAVTPIEGTNVIEITAAADDPDLAAEVASAYAEGVIEVRQQQLKPKVQAAIDETRSQLESLADPTGNTAAELRIRLSQLEAISDGTDPTLSIAQLADPPSSPTGRPNWLLLLIAATSGTILGVGVSVLMRMATARRIEDEQMLTDVLDVPILARITWRNPLGRRGEQDADPRDGFRQLRDQLVFRSSGRPEGAPASEVVVLIGVSAGDAPARPAAGLAIAIQRAGETATTITVDRAPEGRAADPKAAGLRAAIAEARAQSDFVVVDAGTTSTIGPALPILHDADHVVLVIRFGRTRTTDLIRASELLLATGTRDLAALLALDGRRGRPQMRLRRANQAGDAVRRDPAQPPDSAK